MSLKRSAKESLSSTIQPSLKKRRLNSTTLPKHNSTSDNNPCTLSYYDYSKNKLKKSTTNFNDIQKHNFIHSLTKQSYLYGHTGCVNTICWEKSGRHICTGSDDQTIRLWDVFGIKYDGKTPKMLCILKGHLSNVFTAKFMYNSSVFGINNTIVSGGNDANINIYDINHSPITFKPYNKNKNIKTPPNSLFIKPLYSYYHHSRKILRTAVHRQKPFEIFSCSADGTIRHFDIRKKYKKNKYINLEMKSEDIIIQGFGGGPRKNRGRFNESLLYDFNSFNKHYEIYSIDINPIKSYEILTCCSDGYIRIFDLRLRKHYTNICNNNNNNSNINSLYKYHKNNAILLFYNFRIKYPQHCHPTDCKYNSDGTEILTTHIHDAAYLYINPTNINYNIINNPKKRNQNDTQNIIKFIEEDFNHENDGNDNENIIYNSNSESDYEDYEEFTNMFQFAVMSRIEQQINDDNNRNMFRIDSDTLDHVEALMDRRKEVLRVNCSEYNFQDILFDLVSKQEAKLIKLQEIKNENEFEKKENDKLQLNNCVRFMKWNKDVKNGMECIQKDCKVVLPPVESNNDIIKYYHNEYYKLAYKYYIDDKMDNKYNYNGMNIGEELELHNLDKDIYYFGKYLGHIHCETIKEIGFFSDNYIITGSDDKKIYIYDRLNGDIVNILNNETNIVNNIAIHPYLPMFVSSGLDSHITLWAPKGFNNNNEFDNISDDIDYKQLQKNCTQQVVDNLVRLRHRAGFDIL